MKKKVLLITLASILLFNTGCSNEKQLKKNEDPNKEISTLKKGDQEVFNNMMVLDDNTIETEIGLRKDYLDNYMIGVTTQSRTGMYIAVKVKKDYKEKVEKLINNYLASIDVYLEDSKAYLDDAGKAEVDVRKKMYKEIYKEEYKGYNIYIASTEKDAILKILKDRIK